MRILFFLEPFPVRGRPLDFQWVLDGWGRLAAALKALGAQPTFATSDAIRQANPAFPHPLLSPASLGLSPVVTGESTEIDAAWIRLMRDGDDPQWRPVIEALIDRTAPEAIVSWTVNAPLAAAASARGLVIMHQELGPMRRPNTPLYFCDPVGVNGLTALDSVWPSLAALPLPPDAERELDVYWRECVPPPPHARDEARRLLGLDPQRRTLAVFLQVERDSNVLAWSRVGGNAAVLDLVSAAADPDRHEIVVKPHPGEPALPPGAPGRLRVVPQEFPSMALVEAADAVLCINSSIGFEALVREKVVYTFGASPYAGRGCTRDFGLDVGALRNALARETWCLSGREEDLRRRLVHFLVFRYLVPHHVFWDAGALLARLERWRELASRNAPLADWFGPELRTVRLRDLRAELELRAATEKLAQLGEEREALRVHLEAAQREIAAVRRELVATTEELTQARAELVGLRASAGMRLQAAVRRVPGARRIYRLLARLLSLLTGLRRESP